MERQERSSRRLCSSGTEADKTTDYNVKNEKADDNHLYSVLIRGGAKRWRIDFPYSSKTNTREPRYAGSLMVTVERYQSYDSVG